VSASSRKPNFSRASSSRADDLEDLLLHLGVVQADRAAADLEAVEHQVVAVTEHVARVGLQHLDALVVRAREDVVRRGPALVLVALEERRVHDPQEVPVAAAARLGDEPSSLPRWRRRLAITVVHARLGAELEEDEVPVLRAAPPR
jgi:hypothetical protein